MSKINITYQVYSQGRWLPNVTDLSDYAGIYGSPIQGIYANLSRGNIKYRVRTTNGSWLSWVTDRSDYAGIIGKNIDAIQMETQNLTGYNAKYRVYVGGRWLPWVVGLEDYAGIYGQNIEAIQVEIISTTSGGGGTSTDVTYQVYSQGRWLPNVTNLSDYAGIYGSPIQGIYANLSRGNIKYRVRTTNGSWLPWVVDRSDYAGIIGKNIDAIQMETQNLTGYNAKYRAYVGGRWLPWVVGLEDYAGIYGQNIEAIQVEIVPSSSSGGGGEPTYPPVPGAKKVFIDPGHGGSDPGAVGNGLREKDITLSISNKVANLLKAKGIAVEFSRTNDSYVEVENRAYMANNWGASLFVSIHANAFSSSSARGTECYTYPNTSAANKTLSANVASSIANQLGVPNRGHREQDFAVLRLTNMPAILVETAFITNSNDAYLLKNRQDDFAKCIANQILNYFGVTTDYTEVLKEASKTGLFEDCGVSFGLFNSRKHIKTLSFRPQIDLFGELSLTGNIGATDSIDLSVGAQKLADLVNRKLEFNNIKVNFTTENLKATFSQIGISLQQTDNLKYDINFIAPSKVEIIVEHKITVKGIDVFQRLIILISKIDDPTAHAVLLPVVALQHNPIDTYDYSISNPEALLLLFACLGIAYISGGTALPQLASLLGVFVAVK